MHLLLCHFLLLLLLAAASHGDSSDGTYDSSMCQLQPYKCGNVNISYPFYLSKTLKGNNNSYCGYAGLAIDCEDDKPILQLNGIEKYMVTNIGSYGSGGANVMSLADLEVLDGNISCLRIDHNVTFPANSWLYVHDSAVDYLVFFLNCNFPSLYPKPPTDPITCGNFGGGLWFVLPKVLLPENYRDWSQACSRSIEVPVLKNSITMDPNDSSWRNGGYASVLRQGFQLAWNDSGRQAPCTQCEQSEGRCGYNQNGDFVSCLCTDGRVSQQNCIGGALLKRGRKLYIIAGSSSALLLCLIIIVGLFSLKKYGPKRMSKGTPRIESFLQKNGTLHPKRYTYAEVKKMTKSFAEKLGQGGFGAVYSGNLSDGNPVAVKMLKESNGDGDEFINEVASISRTSHVNVVTLLGFCLQGSNRALIYEYMPNGSLERYASKNNSKGGISLTWEKLFDIAVGIARGLEYLHRGCNTRIVHFDIKPHNILLDQDFCPKISDFGMAKLCANKESIISIGGARGTIGYIAPEVYSKQFGAISSKSDVYSYGMMVLEMVGARERNIDANSESSSHYFPQWIYQHLDEYCVSASEINGETTELVRKMIVVGLWCIQLIPTNRPTMTRAVEMLEGSTSDLELPPKVLLSL